MKTVCVCGAGTMGSGIAQLAATAGFSTILYELNEAVLEKAEGTIMRSLSKLSENKKLAEEKEKIFERILFTRDIRLCSADIVIEAIIEKLPSKISLFNQLAELNGNDAIFATNTSSLSVRSIADGLKNPERVAGMHFFNPAPLMKLVEIVRTNSTSDRTIDIVTKLALKMGKTPVNCSDSPGFIVNRVARPFYIESLRVAEKGLVDFENIDAILEATGFKMGPFRLMDLIGNDINYAVSCSVFEQLGEPARLRPSLIQKSKVEKGEFGKKSGKGYYSYNLSP